jgi:hypothetical protein
MEYELVTPSPMEDQQRDVVNFEQAKENECGQDDVEAVGGMPGGKTATDQLTTGVEKTKEKVLEASTEEDGLMELGLENNELHIFTEKDALKDVGLGSKGDDLMFKAT